MNPDLASQLNSSNLSNGDIQNLLKALSQTSLGKKGSKLSPQDRNNLLSKMNNSENSAEYMVEKEDITKNMTEEEKKQYHREELRKKLREKQGKFKESRCSKVLLKKKYEEQLDKIQSLNIPEMPTENTENVVNTENTENVVNTENTENIVVEPKENKLKESSEEEQLEDFFN